MTRENLPGMVRKNLAECGFSWALDSIFAVVSNADSYIDRQAPWTLRKTDTARMQTVLAVLCQTLRTLATVLQPFMPGTMSQLLDQLGVPADARQLEALVEPIRAGTSLPVPQGIFPRYLEEAASAG